MPGRSDHYSQAAAMYAAYRPDYPATLFEWLRSHAPGSRRAWDCGTGSGQAAVGLARHFASVIATDSSYAQLVHARRDPHVHYVASTAEDSALRQASMEIVTVAQALHWFDLPSFYREVRRVLVPGGVLAVWTYGLLSIDSSIDERMSAFHKDEVGPYWPAERALVDAAYEGISFPFRELDPPTFAMEVSWTLEQLAGYLSTWSAVMRYTRSVGENPVGSFIDSLKPLWGPDRSMRRVKWPMHMRIGRV